MQDKRLFAVVETIAADPAAVQVFASRMYPYSQFYALTGEGKLYFIQPETPEYASQDAPFSARLTAESAEAVERDDGGVTLSWQDREVTLYADVRRVDLSR